MYFIWVHTFDFVLYNSDHLYFYTHLFKYCLSYLYFIQHINSHSISSWYVTFNRVPRLYSNILVVGLRCSVQINIYCL